MSRRASASKTLMSDWSKDEFIRRTYHGAALPRPSRYEPLPKAPGSFELTRDGLVEVE